MTWKTHKRREESPGCKGSARLALGAWIGSLRSEGVTIRQACAEGRHGRQRGSGRRIEGAVGVVDQIRPMCVVRGGAGGGDATERKT